MILERVSATLSLEVKSPFIFPDMESNHRDDIAARRHWDGSDRLIIPQEQVRGVLRAELNELACGKQEPLQTEIKNAVRCLFGPETDKPEGDNKSALGTAAAERGHIFPSDLVCDGFSDLNRRNRIEIDETDGVVKEGALLFVELGEKSGCTATFQGDLVFYVAKADVGRTLQLLDAAAKRIGSIGGMKSIGFGEVVEAGVTEQAPPPAQPTTSTPGQRVLVGTKVDRPFLVDATRSAENVYVGSPEITGGTIKALIGQAAEHNGTSIPEAALTALSISHGTMTGAAPQLGRDAFIVGNDQRHFVRQCPPDVDLHEWILDQGTDNLRFQGDWKAEDWKDHGTSSTLNVTYDTRAHSAIDSHRSQVRDEMFYVYHSIKPVAEHIFTIDFSNVNDAAASQAIWNVLGEGFDGLGKTDARIEFNLAGATAVQASQVPSDLGNVFDLELTSAAVIASPADGADLTEAYGTAFAEILPDTTLEWAMADQDIAGGYVGWRFGTQGKYSPFWVTKPGSVFRLRTAQGFNPARLADALRYGLPARAQWSDWNTSPFQPENGFGRFRISEPGTAP